MKRLLLAIALLTLTSCAPKPEPQAIEPTPAVTEQTPSSDRIQDMNEAYEIGGLVITVKQVGLNADGAILALTVENPGENAIAFYPDQGSLVMDDRQLDADPSMTQGDQSGEIQPGVTKASVIVYPASESIDYTSVKDLRFVLGQALNDSTNEITDVAIELTLE